MFKKVESQLRQLTTLDLQFVSPELLKARDLELAVPGMTPQAACMNSCLMCFTVLGTYQSGRPIVTIIYFATKLSVIQSKQRPRRLSLKGSDGRDYQFVLKGSCHVLHLQCVWLTNAF